MTNSAPHSAQLRLHPDELAAKLASMAKIGWTLQSVICEPDELVVTFAPPLALCRTA
jgi:hypothetical protein